MEVSLLPGNTAAAAGPADPVALHPALWRAHQLGRPGREGAWATGFAALDAVLPGGGWPAGALTELLLPHPGVGEWRLLAPVLAAVQQGRSGDGVARPAMLFGPPGQPCAWALAALGLDLGRLVVVHGRGQPRGRARAGLPLPAQDLLWALEQALASGQVGAALAWLPPRLPADALRRLQLAAQAHPGPVFLFREVEARTRPSAAPLRLQLTPGAPDELRLRVLKRRGPLLDAPLALALPPVLSPLARARALARADDVLPADAGTRPGGSSGGGRGGGPGGGAGALAHVVPGHPRRPDRPHRPDRPDRPDRPAPTVTA